MSASPAGAPIGATTTRATCRVCGSASLTDVFSLGTQFVSDFVPRDRIGEGIQAPLDLIRCGMCSLVQLRHTAPQEILYSRHYWYRSGVTETMRHALREVTADAERDVSLKAGDVVLDIGANDGTLLDTYSVSGIVRVGCDPANNLVAELRERAEYVIHDFWTFDAFDALARRHGLPKARIVTAIGMFYDLEDPNQFIRDARRALAEDGVFVAQLMCLAPMLEQNDVGNICHEHLEYYSFESLRHLFESNGLEVFRVTQNDANGGSYRIFARHARRGSIPYPERCGPSELRAFTERVAANRDACVRFIRAEVASGKRVYVYGASTKGNVILQYYGLDATLIAGAADRSPEKWGRFTAGSWIPIVSEAEARQANPDYFLVLPWAFLSEFHARESAWRERGGRFIVPLPEFRVVA